VSLLLQKCSFAFVLSLFFKVFYEGRDKKKIAAGMFRVHGQRGMGKKINKDGKMQVWHSSHHRSKTV